MASDLDYRYLLENHFFPEDLKELIATVVGHYNHRRYNKSLGT